MESSRATSKDEGRWTEHSAAHVVERKWLRARRKPRGQTASGYCTMTDTHSAGRRVLDLPRGIPSHGIIHDEEISRNQRVGRGEARCATVRELGPWAVHRKEGEIKYQEYCVSQYLQGEGHKVPRNCASQYPQGGKLPSGASPSRKVLTRREPGGSAGKGRGEGPRAMQ